MGVKPNSIPKAHLQEARIYVFCLVVLRKYEYKSAAYPWEIIRTICNVYLNVNTIWFIAVPRWMNPLLRTIPKWSLPMYRATHYLNCFIVSKIASAEQTIEFCLFQCKIIQNPFRTHTHPQQMLVSLVKCVVLYFRWWRNTAGCKT